MFECYTKVDECKKLIVVYSESRDKTLKIAKSNSDLVLFAPKGNIGLARAVGLREVKTPYCASIDSDEVVNNEWYEWCIKTIQQEDVAACQGFAKPVGRTYEIFMKNSFSKGWDWGDEDFMLRQYYAKNRSC